MTGAFRPEPEASAELEDAAVWYEGQRQGLGLELVEAVDLALEQIAGWGSPSSWTAQRLARSQGPGQALPISRGVSAMGRSFRILAFAHDSREPGYWLSRIRK